MAADSALQEKVRAINDSVRTAALNAKYYSCRLQSTKRFNLVLEIVVAITTSSAIAAWSVWQTGSGAAVWKLLAGIAAVVSVIKPFLGLDKEIERYSELVVGYRALTNDLRLFIGDLKVAGVLDESGWIRFGDIRQKMGQLGLKDDLSPRKKLVQRVYDEVNKEIPAASLWWPTEAM